MAMSRILIFLATLWCGLAQPASERAGTLDFYGYGSMDVARIRAALTFHEGDPVPSGKARNAATAAIKDAVGRDAQISALCCLQDGRSAVFIGLAEPDAPLIRYNPVPPGRSELSPDAWAVFEQLDKHLFAAVEHGTAQEDDSLGYALIQDPATRADQLKLRAWAKDRTGEILHVLEDSRDERQRAYAAEALGYAGRSPRQIAGLVSAAFDSNDLVRNNAVRALEVMVSAFPDTVRQIPAKRFVPLLHSLEWKDRNKASWLFFRMTESGDPALLKMLHEEALTPLREMAQWKSEGHAWAALIILGRIGGIGATRLAKMTPEMKAEILQSVK